MMKICSWRSRLPSLILLFLSWLCFMPLVTPFIDQICVNLGYNNLVTDKNNPKLTGLYVLNSNTYEAPVGVDNFCKSQFWVGSFNFHKTNGIGADKFSSEANDPMALTRDKLKVLAPNLPPTEGCCDLYDTTTSEINMFGVKHNGNFLNGWLGFEVSIKEEVVWTFVQVSDERGNAIGEFVTTNSSKCDDLNTADDTVAIPKEPQFLPCTATGLQEAKPSQSVAYMAKSRITGKNPNDVDNYMGSPSNVGKGLKMKFTWRLNEHYCNRHAKFRVVLYFLPSKSTSPNNYNTIFKRGDWLTATWYGVADIVPNTGPSPTSLDCGTSTATAITGSNDFWIKKIEALTSTNDNVNNSTVEIEGPKFPPTLYKSCRTYITRLNEYIDDVSNQPTYGGRCEKVDEKKFKPAFYKTTAHSKSSVDVPHQCLKNDQAEYPQSMENYKEYMDKKAKTRKTACGKISKCRKKIEKHLRFPTGRFILKSRAYHGMVFTWAALFFIPVSNFMARFFKETFLSVEIVGFRVWYFVHVGFTIMVINVSVSGLISNGKVTRVWGRSWTAAGTAHRSMGWTCMMLYVLVVVLGPFRPLNQKPRLVIMILHAFLGYLQYFLGLITVMNSALIPGSPSATFCYKKASSFDPNKFSISGDVYQHEIATAVTWWICLDLIFHGLMSLMQWRADRALDVHRRHYFPLVPMVDVHERWSYKCFRYRTLVLIIYVFIISTIVIVTCSRLYATDWKGCDCGPMTCTHKSIAPDSFYPEVQCGRLAAIREKAKGS